MTAVEWLAYELNQFGTHIPKLWLKEALRMEAKQKGYSEEDMLLFAKFVYEDDGSFIDNDGNVKKETLKQYQYYKETFKSE